MLVGMRAQAETGQAGMRICKDAIYDRLMGRPATGETPVSNFRIPKQLREAAKARAKAEGRSLTEVVVFLLQRWVSSPPRRKPDDEG